MSASRIPGSNRKALDSLGFVNVTVQKWLAQAASDLLFGQTEE